MKGILKLLNNSNTGYNNDNALSTMCLLNNVFTAVISFNVHNDSMKFELSILSSNLRDKKRPQEVT